jgi:hypothetical protein
VDRAAAGHRLPEVFVVGEPGEPTQGALVHVVGQFDDVGTGVTHDPDPSRALWNRHAAGLQRTKLDKTPLDLLKDATGLELAQLLALGFACWAMTTHDRVNGPVRINPFMLVKLPKETVERFLALFATTPEELASELAACELPWQMLPLQTRPLLRIGDDVMMLDEPFLLEAVTTGLCPTTSARTTRRPWSVAYAEMVEALADELIRALAPVLLDGSSAFFTEEGIKAAFATKKETPPNIDAGIDFGMGVTLSRSSTST